jgi:N-acetyl-gamma-glutamylphosphate reductase
LEGNGSKKAKASYYEMAGGAKTGFEELHWHKVRRIERSSSPGCFSSGMAYLFSRVVSNMLSSAIWKFILKI